MASSTTILTGIVRLLVRIFFRSVEVTGTRHVPRDRGGLLVAWHPNGLVDPCLITASFPGRVVFGAKHGLFDWPVLGRVMRAFGAVPIYRPAESGDLSEEERRAMNNRSLEALANRIVEGAYAALFPEGLSHDEPFLAPLKPGAARLYYAARMAMPPDAPPPAVIPVGLHYADKTLFRSRALVWFYPPLSLPPELDITPSPEEDDAEMRERVLALTDLIETALESAVHPTEDWTTHRLINRVRKLVRAERAARAGIPSDRPTIEESVAGFARVQQAYYDRLSSHPAQARRLRARVARYDEELTALGLDDHELDSSRPLGGPGVLARTVLQSLFVFLLLPPLLVLGYLVNGPPALIVYAITKRLATEPDLVATYKLIAGSVLFPLAWIAAAAGGALAYERFSGNLPWLPDTPVLAGLALSVLAIIGGAHVLRYQALARQVLKNLRVRFMRNRQSGALERVRAERASIYEDVIRIAEEIGLNDPGSPATQDGASS